MPPPSSPRTDTNFPWPMVLLLGAIPFPPFLILTNTIIGGYMSYKASEVTLGSSMVENIAKTTVGSALGFGLGFVGAALASGTLASAIIRRVA